MKCLGCGDEMQSSENTGNGLDWHCTSCIARMGGGAVDHPAHYGGDTVYETIKVMRAWHGDDAVYWFCILSAEKYLSRAGKKGAALEDIQKARWYIDYAISLRSPK